MRLRTMHACATTTRYPARTGYSHNVFVGLTHSGGYTSDSTPGVHHCLASRDRGASLHCIVLQQNRSQSLVQSRPTSTFNNMALLSSQGSVDFVSSQVYTAAKSTKVLCDCLLPATLH